MAKEDNNRSNHRVLYAHKHVRINKVRLCVKKKKKLKFIERIKRKRSIIKSLVISLDRSNWIFWIFIGDRDWSEREGMRQLKHNSPCVSLGFF